VRRSIATLLVVLLAPVAAAGCGGDDEPEATPTRPELTVPETDTQTTETPTETAPTTTQPPSEGGEGGGTTAPPPARTQPDSPGNDVPPEPGTPESRFERFCRENPGACG
jgi:hypothetical protein